MSAGDCRSAVSIPSRRHGFHHDGLAGNLALVGRGRRRCLCLSRPQLCPATSQPVREVELLTRALPTISRGKGSVHGFPSVNAAERYQSASSLSVSEALKFRTAFSVAYATCSWISARRANVASCGKGRIPRLPRESCTSPVRKRTPAARKSSRAHRRLDTTTPLRGSRDR